MKKIIVLFFLLLTVLILFPTFTEAVVVSWCDASTIPNCCEESNRGAYGLVPCGRATTKTYECLYGYGQPTITITILSSSEVSDLIAAQNKCVEDRPSGTSGFINAYFLRASLACRCELYHVFILALNIYKFVVWIIALPLAGLLIMIGGVLMLVSGGPGGKNPVTGIASPNLYSTARRMLTGAAVGLFLILGSWLIINIVLLAIGYTGAWFIF